MTSHAAGKPPWWAAAIVRATSSKILGDLEKLVACEILGLMNDEMGCFLGGTLLAQRLGSSLVRIERSRVELQGSGILRKQEHKGRRTASWFLELPEQLLPGAKPSAEEISALGIRLGDWIQAFRAGHNHRPGKSVVHPDHWRKDRPPAESPVVLEPAPRPKYGNDLDERIVRNMNQFLESRKQQHDGRVLNGESTDLPSSRSGEQPPTNQLPDRLPDQGQPATCHDVDRLLAGSVRSVRSLIETHESKPTTECKPLEEADHNSTTNRTRETSMKEGLGRVLRDLGIPPSLTTDSRAAAPLTPSSVPPSPVQWPAA